VKTQEAGGRRFWRTAQAVFVLVLSFGTAALVIRYRMQVQDYLAHIGPIRYVLAVLVMAIVASAPFSVTDALAIMNGVLFGPVKGSLVNAAGIVIAACIGYAIARTTSKLLDVEKRIQSLPGWVRRFKVGSPLFLITVRIIPGLGGTVATNVAAAFRVPLIVHVWTMSAIAIPICTLLAIFGDEVSIKVAHFYQSHKPHIPHFRRHHKPTPSPSPAALEHVRVAPLEVA
jgi:uncharacterized membrane protein YdjX (TVP38/TMEM64 family)